MRDKRDPDPKRLQIIKLSDSYEKISMFTMFEEIK